MDSIDRPTLDRLSEPQQARLAELLDVYLQGWEAGTPPDLNELVGQDHDLLEPLQGCVEGLHQLTELAFEDAATSSAYWTPRNESDITVRSLGDFELFEVVGEGAMGTVYRARQVSLDRIVALKVLGNYSQFDARQVARFTNEAKLTAELDHPNIVSTLAIGCDDGVHYFAMRYIAGLSLDKLLEFQRQHGSTAAGANQPFWQWEPIVSLVVQVANGLHAAHEMGVVHRDIKPSNLICESPDGDAAAAIPSKLIESGGKLWITDFGLARCQYARDLTRSGDVLGTFRYMSPEQARGESALVDGRSDVYSLGLTLYELLSLQPAFAGEESPTVLSRIERHDITPLQQFRSGLPRDLYAVVEKATARDRDKRYQTARAFADDLQRVLLGQPTVARAPTLIDRGANWAYSNRRTFTGVLALGVAALTVSMYVTARVAAAKRDSDAHRIRALENERIAREAIEQFGGQVAQWLESVPAAEPMRRRVLGETLQYYQRIIAEGNESRETRFDLAIVQGKIGSLQEELGDYAQAANAYREAERLLTQLVEESQPQVEHQLTLGICQNNLGHVLHRLGKLDQAATAYLAAEKCFHDLQQIGLPQAGTDQDDLRHQHAVTENNLAKLLMDLDSPNDAERYFRSALANLEQITGIVPDNLKLTVQVNLAEAVTLRSTDEGLTLAASTWRSLQSEQTRPVATADAGRKTHAYTAYRLPLHGNPPASDLESQTVSQLVRSQQLLATLAGIFAHGRQWDLAEKCYQQAADKAEQLTYLRPNAQSYRRQRVEYLHHAAVAWLQLDQPRNASIVFKQALSELDKIPQEIGSVAGDFVGDQAAAPTTLPAQSTARPLALPSDGGNEDPLAVTRISIYKSLIRALHQAGQKQEARQYEQLVGNLPDA